MKTMILFFIVLFLAACVPVESTPMGNITSHEQADGDSVGSVVLSPKVPSPDYVFDKTFVRIGVDASQKLVTHLEGYLDIIPGKVAAQRYVLNAGDPGGTIADIVTAFAAGQPKPIVPRILADELLIVVNETVLPVDRTLILQNAGEGGVSAYEFIVMHFRTASF